MSINFSNLNSLSIPEGEVVKILTPDNTEIWKSSQFNEYEKVLDDGTTTTVYSKYKIVKSANMKAITMKSTYSVTASNSLYVDPDGAIQGNNIYSDKWSNRTAILQYTYMCYKNLWYEIVSGTSTRFTGYLLAVSME